LRSLDSRSKVKSRTLMHDTSEPLTICEIDMGKQGMTLTKTTLIHELKHFTGPSEYYKEISELYLKMQVVGFRAKL